ncbi:MFS transporter [Mycolicibacterium duvalii]|uniref:MFS transporter n=1 Tax=Mycolicibacterium duvalii TaxID=39688 RepID=A0A7I7K336_9MYCO|nr:MFS transporter [Mycolicibacterium duvalii]MCV7367854.1 MFS transporter [Mycolicibacterium duvalii]PEG42536.1 MFS transporter [Mycolicibacterium duvalii]BBX18556.1 MFS transporter [Mycolicibacterium duvalii]
MVTLSGSAQDIDGEVASLPKRGRIWLLVVASFNVLLVISSMVALNAALPDLALETSATQSQLTWIVDGYTLALACLLLPAGALGDRFGRRGALLVGLVIFGVASCAPTVLDSPTQIIVARAVAGVGAAFIMPATLSLLTAAFPKDERNKAVGIWAGVAGSGAVVGFLGTGLMLQFFSWQSIFYAFTAAALLLFVATLTIGSSRDETAAPIDWLGGSLIATAIAVFVLGIVEAPVRGWTDPIVLGCLGAGPALAAVFAVVQLRRTHPLLDVRLFRRPDFATGAVGITFIFMANFGFFYLAMQHMQLVMGYTPLQTAFALSPLALPVLVLGFSLHLYLPKVGLRFAVTVGLLLIATGLYLMRFLDGDSTFTDLMWPMLVMASGIGFCTAPTTSAIMNATPDEKQGVASAVNDATREIGAAVGIAVAGSILAALYHSSLAPRLEAFPDEIRSGATDSLAYALSIAERMGPQGAELTRLAEDAFLHSMSQALLVLSVVTLAGALFVAVWSPGRDGRQWAPLRRGSREEFRSPVADHRDGGVRAATGRHRKDGPVDD